MTLSAPSDVLNMRVGDFRTPFGHKVEMLTREDTVDFDICTASIVEDEYGLGKWPLLEGWALDIGAHVGAVTVALAKDHPKLKVLAVEVVPENVAQLRQNVLVNSVQDQVVVVDKAAGAPGEVSRGIAMRHRSHPVATPEYVYKHRHIGNSFWSPAYGGAFDSEVVEVESVSLGALLKDYGISELAFMKIDAEGAEWAFLRDKAVAKVDYIIGEFHWDYSEQGDHAKGAKKYKREKTPQAELHRLLDATHDVTVADHPTIGHFEAWRKSA